MWQMSWQFVVLLKNSVWNEKYKKELKKVSPWVIMFPLIKFSCLVNKMLSPDYCLMKNCVLHIKMTKWFKVVNIYFEYCLNSNLLLSNSLVWKGTSKNTISWFIFQEIWRWTFEYRNTASKFITYVYNNRKFYIVNSFLWLVSRQICVLTYFLWSKTRAWIIKSNKTFDLFLLWITMKVFLPNMLFMFVFSLVVFSWSIKVKKC